MIFYINYTFYYTFTILQNYTILTLTFHIFNETLKQDIDNQKMFWITILLEYSKWFYTILLKIELQSNCKNRSQKCHVTFSFFSNFFLKEMEVFPSWNNRVKMPIYFCNSLIEKLEINSIDENATCFCRIILNW